MPFIIRILIQNQNVINWKRNLRLVDQFEEMRLSKLRIAHDTAKNTMECMRILLLIPYPDFFLQLQIYINGLFCLSLFPSSLPSQ